MLRAYCVDRKNEWDNGVHLVLFAAVKNSPFELIFGQTVREASQRGLLG